MSDVNDRDPGALKALLEKYAQAGAFGAGDKLGAAIQGGLAKLHGGSFGDTYDQALVENRDVLKRSGQYQPAASAVGNLLGTIPSLAAGAPRLGITATSGLVGAATDFNQNDQATMADRLKRALATGGLSAAVGKASTAAPILTSAGALGASYLTPDKEQKAGLMLAGVGGLGATAIRAAAPLIAQGAGELAAKTTPEPYAQLRSKLWTPVEAPAPGKPIDVTEIPFQERSRSILQKARELERARGLQQPSPSLRRSTNPEEGTYPGK